MAGIAEIREQIVRDPIAGAKSLCDYLATRPAWAARRAEADLKRSDLERIQHELDLYGPDPGLQAARNRNVHFLIQLCLEIEAELCPGPAIPPDLYEIRARQLADHIAQDLALLKEYEDGLRYEEDPRRRARYRREIERLQESLQKYRREYEDLQAQVAGAPSLAMDRVGFQLQQMDAKLDTLLQGQTAIRTDVAGVRQALLDRYEAGERTIIASIAESLNQGQLATVEGVLNAIEEGRIAETEMVEMLDSVRQILTNVEQHLVSLLPAQPRVSEIVSSPELDVKHKLKITLPIIPLLLSYEGELGLGMRANLEEMWRRLLGKVKRPNRLCDTKDLRDIRDILASLASIRDSLRSVRGFPSLAVVGTLFDVLERTSRLLDTVQPRVADLDLTARFQVEDLLSTLLSNLSECRKESRALRQLTEQQGPGFVLGEDPIERSLDCVCQLISGMEKLQTF